MLCSKNKLRGQVTVTVYDKSGNVKTLPKSFFRKMFFLPSRKMIFRHHNTITNQGDGLLADLMSNTPTQNKVDGTNGYMIVGNGWTGTSTKSNTNVNKAVNTYKKLDEGFPQTKYPFGESGQNVVLYRTSFLAGELVGDGINEVALMNGNTVEAKCLA